MLMLTGRVNESVVMRDKNGKFLCEVSIALIKPNQVMLGFEAGSDVLINRKIIDERKFPSTSGNPVDG